MLKRLFLERHIRDVPWFSSYEVGDTVLDWRVKPHRITRVVKKGATKALYGITEDEAEQREELWSHAVSIFVCLMLVLYIVYRSW